VTDGSSTDGSAGEIVFAEPGGRWHGVAYGPLLCLVVLVFDLVRGGGVHWAALIVCAAVLALIGRWQIAAARTHVSVELTGTGLRNGVERVPVSRIAEVLAPPRAGREQPWETARVLGELADVPRRRRPVGLRLADGSLVRAWARDEAGLRAALAATLDATKGQA
jgi:hypothetical protein